MDNHCQLQIPIIDKKNYLSYGFVIDDIKKWLLTLFSCGIALKQGSDSSNHSLKNYVWVDVALKICEKMTFAFITKRYITINGWTLSITNHNHNRQNFIFDMVL